MKTIICILLVIGLSGCIQISLPIENEKFSQLSNFKDISGKYQSIGKEKKQLFMHFSDYKSISNIFLPATRGKPVNQLGFVEILSSNENIIIKEYLDNETFGTVASLKYNKNFKFKNGKIILSKGHVYQESLFGINWHHAKLGLDTSGNLKHSETEWAVGLVLFFIPIFLFAHEENIFEVIR